jgi:hypothetical protein
MVMAREKTIEEIASEFATSPTARWTGKQMAAAVRALAKKGA